jgi:hypothetical protein
MTELEKNKPVQSAADELQSAVDKILSWATLADTSKTVEAAEALGLAPASLQIVGAQRNLEKKFADAITPIKEALRAKEDPTREDIAKMVQAFKTLDTLLAIIEKHTALHAKASAENILRFFKKRDQDVIELTLPKGTSVQEAGKLLNSAAKGEGLNYPVFDENIVEIWEQLEAKPAHKTKPGHTYRFKILPTSVNKTRFEQENVLGKGAPLGALAIAEACERLVTRNNGSLFRDQENRPLLVRGSFSGMGLESNPKTGVTLSCISDGHRLGHVAFASLEVV